MIAIKDTRYPNTAALLQSAVGIAEHYGFAHLDTLPKEQLTTRTARANEIEIAFARRDERALPSAARACLAHMREPHHTILGWRVTSSNTIMPTTTLELHIAGTHSNVAEALLIAVAHAILEEAGFGERRLSINYLGASESCGRFVRDVGLYLRKHIASISPALRTRAAIDPLGTLVQLIERGHPAAPRAPQAVEYLGEEERQRFWEVLEYMESSGLPYELDAHLLGSRDCWSQTLFEISSNDAETGATRTLAQGGRYDPLISRIAKTPVGAAMVSIVCETRGSDAYKHEQRSAPSIYMAHLGVEARRRMLAILGTLHRAGIRVRHGIWHERIGEQMKEAAELAAPYVLIIGHKEALEDSILVRTVATNTQETVPLRELVGYLHRHRLA